jgi:hypothetical protein
MGKRDPTREAAYREMRDENGRLLRFKKYADRELLIMTGGDQDAPQLELMHYDDLADRNRNRDWISRKMSKRYGLDADLEQRCWYSGVQLYLVPWKLYDKLFPKLPWVCSREHLVCERNGGLGNGISNIVVAGYAINVNLGHLPLPVKLLHRQVFATMDLDRDNPVWDTMTPLHYKIIETENQYALGGHYPWQPWAFEPGTRDHRIAQAFHEEMMAVEADFLAQDIADRAQWLDDFTWRW